MAIGARLTHTRIAAAILGVLLVSDIAVATAGQPVSAESTGITASTASSASTASTAATGDSASTVSAASTGDSASTVSAVSSSPTASTACPSRDVPATAFGDTRTSPHRVAIDCAVWWGLAQGRTDTQFAPGRDVTRGQTAQMLVGLLESTDHLPAEITSAGFRDTEGHRFEDAIDVVATLGIVSGTSPDTFAPDEPIAREQMATMLAGVFARAYETPLPEGPVPFDDVTATNVHRDAIGQLVRAEITSGVSASSFAPRRHVTREQMASFITRSATRLVLVDLATHPVERPGPDDAYASRMRAAWVHLFDDALKTPAGVQRVVDELAAADANAVIAQVSRRHDAYYNSDVLPRTPDPQLDPGFDVLEALITAAHAAGIEVHAWFGVAPTWHRVYDDLPAPDGWVPTEHGQRAPVADRWVTRTRDGTWTDYLDPGVPAVREHVAEVVGELAERYEIDGVHLDYVRYPWTETDDNLAGYNPAALAAFRADTGRTDTPEPGDREWSDWRRSRTEALVVAAREAIDAGADANGRDVELSAAVITWGEGPTNSTTAAFRQTRAYRMVSQDWERWVRLGRLDAVMPMNYFRSHDAEAAGWFDEWLAYERDLAARSDTQVVPGPGGYLNAPDAAEAQIHEAMRVDGAVMYSYQQPTLDGSRDIWRRMAATRWGYDPQR